MWATLLTKEGLKALPWGKIIIGLIGLSMLIAVGFLKHNLSNARAEIHTLQVERGVVAGELGVAPKDILIKVKAIKAESENRRVALKRINDETLAAKAHEKELDKQLAAEQAANAKKFSKAEKTIKALQTRKPTGDAPRDLKTIEDDSKAAWAGWKAAFYTADIPLIDDHLWKRAEYGHNPVTVEVVPHPTIASLRYNFEARYGPLSNKMWLAGFTVHRPDGVCEIHVMDPRVDNKPWVWGHEFMHCVYGRWHEARL